MLKKVFLKKEWKEHSIRTIALSFSDKPSLTTKTNFMLLHDISYGSHKLNKFEG